MAASTSVDAVTSFGAIFAAGLSTAFGWSIFSTNGFWVSCLGAVGMPFVISLVLVSVTMLTGMLSTWVAGRQLGAKLTIAAPRTTRWQQADMVQSVRNGSTFCPAPG